MELGKGDRGREAGHVDKCMIEETRFLESEKIASKQAMGEESHALSKSMQGEKFGICGERKERKEKRTSTPPLKSTSPSRYCEILFCPRSMIS